MWPAPLLATLTPLLCVAVRLDVRMFRQMCGRAGRFGYDTQVMVHIRLPILPQSYLIRFAVQNRANCDGAVQGEAILLCTPAERRFAEELFSAELPPLRSALLSGSGGGVERLLLEMICADAIKTANAVRSACREIFPGQLGLV